jgi:hypothetical protein
VLKPIQSYHCYCPELGKWCNEIIKELSLSRVPEFSSSLAIIRQTAEIVAVQLNWFIDIFFKNISHSKKKKKKNYARPRCCSLYMLLWSRLLLKLF